MNKLQQYDVKCRQTQNCKCGQKAFIYTIPNRLDETIIQFLSSMGEPAFNFKQTSILRIENENFSITGVRRLKEIRFTIKKESKEILNIFEDALIQYLESLRGK